MFNQSAFTHFALLDTEVTFTVKGGKFDFVFAQDGPSISVYKYGDGTVLLDKATGTDGVDYANRKAIKIEQPSSTKKMFHSFCFDAIVVLLRANLALFGHRLPKLKVSNRS